jgi:stalled ribosome rescue protein Dom34
MAIKIQDRKDNVSGTSTTIKFSTDFSVAPTVVATLADKSTDLENIAISITNVTVDNFTVMLRINGVVVTAPGENIYWIAIYTP